MENLMGYARFKGIVDNLLAGGFISAIVAGAVWWFGPEYVTSLDEFGWTIAAASAFGASMVVLLTIDYLLMINLSFNILRFPYVLLLLPFKFVKLIDRKYEDLRLYIVNNTFAGLLFGGAIWAAIVWMLFRQLVPMPDPCQPTRPCILVVGLQGDDFAARRTGYVRWSLQDAFRRAGIAKTADVVVIPRTMFRVVSSDPSAVHWQAQFWLNHLRGNVLLYGAAPLGHDMTLTVYTRHDDGRESDAGVTLPPNFGTQHAVVLALVASDFAKPEADDGYAERVLWPLARLAAPFATRLPAGMPEKTQETVTAAFADAAQRAGDAGNDDAMRLAIDAYRAMLERGFGVKVDVQVSLAASLNALGARENGSAKFAEAQRIYDAAIAESKQGAERLNEAVEVYREVLKTLDRARNPLRWSEAQFDLGRALEDIGERERVYRETDASAAALLQATEAYRLALTVEQPANDRARIEYRLGCVLESLGRDAGEAARFAEAETAFREALAAYSADKTPLSWADTQFRLGEVLLLSGEAGNDAARMQAAAEALREALKVYNARHVATGNIRIALELLERAQAGIIKTFSAAPKPNAAVTAPAAEVKTQHR